MFQFPEHLEFKHIAIIVVFVIFVLKRILQNKPIVKENNLIISAFLIALLAILLAFEFWKDQLWIGFIVALLGFIAIGKMIWDKYRKD